ncbi:hypothetical protein KC332_g6950 [Hortaea werneckii]|nr:hypothetical protein KC358_g4465 [Hortaea werneckii]KAI6846998.1 hypothetical protein KC350_g3654 [Hortaea werneckii]KAI6939399.1 hypothetical protein KC341_g4236 [Hortaea werneckii]KAI6941529.1 hypothetical protein KC348_g4686 [Hortaea werneckii]KAI6975592.1 hypothetical protein KC321_g4456 [Hortaea werneckii]
MTYEAIARVCGHAVRATSSNLDYCTACRNSRRIREERDRAEMEYSRDWMLHDLLPEEHPRSTMTESRRRFDQARLAFAEDQAWREDRDRRERYEREGRLSRSHDPWGTRESTYRDQTEYRRRSSRYEPGRYADRSGQGFYNTHDPVRDRGYGYEDDVVDVNIMTPQDIRDHILRRHCPIRPVYWHNGELRFR